MDTVASRTPAARATQPDPAMPKRPGLGPHQQPPLPLIQMWEITSNFAASISPVTSMAPVHTKAQNPREATDFLRQLLASGACYQGLLPRLRPAIA